MTLRISKSLQIAEAFRIARCLLIALLSFGIVPSGACLAQSVLSGVVVDISTGDVLPGASIQLQGTFTGTITNREGQFALTVPALPAALVVRFIGYQSQVVEITEESNSALRIELAPSTIILPEITITGEDPAIRIMRRVIEEKKRWRQALQTYSVTAYNRFRLENDERIVSIWESGTSAFWDVDRGVREVSLWQNQTSNMQISELLPAAMFIMNLYDDDIEIAGHTLMGVTHPDALSFYTFSLDAIQARDESEVYLIGVRPKLKTSAGFVGTIAILDEAYAMISANLEPGKAFLFPPPIQYVNAVYAQQFSNFGKDFWLPVDFRADMYVKVGVPGVLVFPEFKLHQLSSLSDFDINVPLPDSLYDQKQLVVVDSSAQKMTALPANRIGVPLTGEEVTAYALIDSSLTFEKAYKPTGMFARFIKTENTSNETTVSVSGGVSKGGGRFPFQIKPRGWYNRVEGTHGHLEAYVGITNNIDLQGMLGYSSAQRFTSSGGGFKGGDPISVRLWYADEILPQYNSDIRSQLFNSYGVLSEETDYFDYFRKQGWMVSATAERLWSGKAKARLIYGNERHSTLDQKFSKSFLGTTLDSRVNRPVSTGRLHYARLELEGQESDFPVPMGPQKKWKISLERGLDGSLLKGGNYTRFEGSILWRIPTFFKRRLLSNALDFRMAAGTIRGSSIPIQKLGMIDGVTFFSFFGGLKTLPGIPYQGTSWGIVAWEHTFRTVPFEIVGWDWAVRRHWDVLVHGAHGLTSNKHASHNVLKTDGLHQEVGVSLSGLLSILRFDTVWRLDKKDFRIGVSLARIF